MSLTGLLLAGGLSRRMGSDKALQLYAGQPLWQRQLAMLRALEPEVIMVSARHRPEWCPAGMEVLLDAEPSCGPLSGLVAGLKQLRTTHLLVLAVDMPQMTGEHLGKLLVLAQPGRGVMPQSDGYFEPLAAVYPAAAAEPAAQALAHGEFSLRKLAQKLVEKNLVQTYLVTDPERALYHNANTPDDLK